MYFLLVQYLALFCAGTSGLDFEEGNPVPTYRIRHARCEKYGAATVRLLRSGMVRAMRHWEV